MLRNNLFSILLIAPIWFLSIHDSKSQNVSAIRQLEIISGQSLQQNNTSINYYIDNPAPPPMPTMDFYNAEFSSFLSEQSNQENELGAKYYNQKKWDKAARHFKKAMKLNPENKLYKAHLDYANRQLNLEKEKSKPIVNPNAKTDAVFLSNFNKDIATLNTKMKTLRKSLASYVPHLGTPIRIVEDGLMLGLFNTEREFWIDQNKPNNPYAEKINMNNPFSKKEFKEGEYYAGTDKSTNMELLRGFVDNALLGKYTLNSKHGKELCSKLSGAHFKRMIAHSNGATITEALIRENVIKVDELNILGGDRSLMNFSGYDDLVKSGKVKKIVVWINPGDIIPIGTSAHLLASTMTENGKYKTNFTQFFNHKLLGHGNTNPNIEYRFLSGPQYQKGQKMEFNANVFNAHDLSTYFENMRIYFELNPSKR